MAELLRLEVTFGDDDTVSVWDITGCIDGGELVLSDRQRRRLVAVVLAAVRERRAALAALSAEAVGR